MRGPSIGTSRAPAWDVLLLLSAPLSALLPLVSGLPWSASLVAGSCAWLYLVKQRGAARARVVGVLLGWAFTLSITTILLTVLAPERAAELVPRGAAYWVEMKPWLLSGVGKESTPSAFIPEHLLHVGAFALLAVVSAGWGALVLGAFLMGYMSFYVGQVVLLAGHPVAAGVLAWHPWALMRVIAFVILGVSLAQLLLARRPLADWWASERRALGLFLLLWVGDILLKSVLAGPWSGLIRSLGAL